MTSYYETLGVDRNASLEEIKKRRDELALKYHPDRAFTSGFTNEEATKKTQEINEAYDVLSDPKKKEMYDNYGEVKERKLGKTSKKNNLTKKEAIEIITEKLRWNKLEVEDLEENDRDYKKEIEHVIDGEVHWKVEQIEERVKENIDNIIRERNENNSKVTCGKDKKKNASSGFFSSLNPTNWFQGQSESINGQEYLDRNYSVNGRSEIKELVNRLIQQNQELSKRNQELEQQNKELKVQVKDLQEQLIKAIHKEVHQEPKVQEQQSQIQIPPK